MMSSFRRFKKLEPSTGAILYHLLIVLLVYKILYDYGIVNVLPTNKNLVLCDAIWYKSIKEHGYLFVPFQTCNLAFFPFFPLIWKILHVSPLAMAIVNFCLFGVSFVFLVKNEKCPAFFYLFFLSIPSLIFFFLPYSEAVFFACSTIIIVGYRMNSTAVSGIGFFLSSLARSVSMLFIPAIIICEMLYDDKLLTKKEKLVRLIINASSAISALLLVAAFQAFQTGKWFYFIGIQKFWKRHWVIPQFPLTTYSPDRIIAIDSISFIIGMVALYYCLKNIFGKFIFSKSWAPQDYFNNRVLLFSLLYLAGTTLLDLLFTFNYKGSASIWSLNRHIFCTPFIVIFLSAFLYKIKLSEADEYFLSFFIIFGVFFTGVYKYVDQTFFYLLFFFTLFVMKFYAKLTPYLVLVYVINVLFQIQFFSNFLKDLWIG